MNKELLGIIKSASKGDSECKKAIIALKEIIERKKTSLPSQKGQFISIAGILFRELYPNSLASQIITSEMFDKLISPDLTSENNAYTAIGILISSIKREEEDKEIKLGCTIMLKALIESKKLPNTISQY